MKKTIVVALALFAGIGASAEEAIGKSYTFTLPEGVTFQSHEKMEFYTFRWGVAPKTALFMLSVNPAPVSASALKPMADIMENTFEEQMKKQGIATDIQKKKAALELGSFKGTELEFVITHAGGTKVRQYMFILHDGKRAWNGQLTAFSDADIETAHMIMKNAKSMDNQPADDVQD